MTDFNRPHVHTFPVDASFGDDEAAIMEAFKEMCIFGRRVTNTGSEFWATLTCNGGCEGIDPETYDIEEIRAS